MPRLDRLFDDHRRRMALQAQPPLDSLTDEQIKRIGEAYYAALLDEDDEVRNEAFEGRSFEESPGTLAARGRCCGTLGKTWKRLMNFW